MKTAAFLVNSKSAPTSSHQEHRGIMTRWPGPLCLETTVEYTGPRPVRHRSRC